MNLTIEKLIYGGDGLARQAEGKAVFVPLVLPGEEISATIAEDKPGFARATVDELLTPSEKRIQPGCAYFGSCGGCHYQHTGYENQLEIKRAILRETFRRTGKFEWQEEIITHAGEPWNYRNRTRMKLQVGREFAIGYRRLASHELLPVEKCPISSPAINRLIYHLWELGREQRVPQGIGEIEFFANHDDSALLLEVYGSPPITGLQEFFRDLKVRMPEVQGLSAFTLSGPHSPAAPEAREVLGQDFLAYRAEDREFRVSAGSFFQTNRFLVDELVQAVTSGLSGRMALDLYAGVGLFANHLSKRFHQVFAVESSPAAAGDLQANAQKNVTAVRATTEQFLQKSINLNADVVVADPPRAGMGEGTTKLLAALRVPRISYLSCDPTTLARDLRLLLDFGYKIEEVHLIDLFPQTFHIESLVRLAR
ncbi:MAG TPA: 23S rRNA (uracil(1939)-C(5))-methyltransferase RlmD [Candidatus Angelobacter sp.]|nr:23S rRNA (uracil(1939)-C(5))-methyltransferase RlmD [Candidatus Angelobacter sp.]